MEAKEDEALNQKGREARFLPSESAARYKESMSSSVRYMSIQGRRPQASVCCIVVGLPPVQVELNRWRDGRETHTRTFFSIFSSSHSTDSLDASCSPRPHVSSAAHENGYTFSPNHCHLGTFALVSGTEKFPSLFPLPNLAQCLRFVKRWEMTRRTAPAESGGPPRSWSASASAIGFHERGREREEGRELPNSRAHFTHLVVTRGRSAPRPCRVSPPPDSPGRSTDEGDEGIVVVAGLIATVGLAFVRGGGGGLSSRAPVRHRLPCGRAMPSVCHL